MSNYTLLKNSLPDSVALIAVGKTFPAASIRELYNQGQKDFGENKVQELLEKSKDLIDTDIRWHFIGHLQSNKIKMLLNVENLVCIYSIDRLKLACKLNEELEKQDRKMNILIQVNTTGESSKFGCEVSETISLIKDILSLKQLKIIGLMTIGKFGATKEETKGYFSILKSLAENISNLKIATISMNTLSMGMSGDYQLAIEEGSTNIRIGQALFGKRNLADSYYWPEN